MKRIEIIDQKMPAAVAEVFNNYEPDVRAALADLRQLILDTAGETAGVGVLTEALKWGQPSFLTSETGSGSTIRIAPTGQKSASDYAIFFICHTNLVDHFEELFGDVLQCEGNRSITFRLGDSHPNNELRECIAMALTYRLN